MKVLSSSSISLVSETYFEIKELRYTLKPSKAKGVMVQVGGFAVDDAALSYATVEPDALPPDHLVTRIHTCVINSIPGIYS